MCVIYVCLERCQYIPGTPHTPCHPPLPFLGTPLPALTPCQFIANGLVFFFVGASVVNFFVRLVIITGDLAGS